MSPAPTVTTERRQYHRVREVFDEAYVLIEPFFSSENRWGGQTLDHLAYRVLRDRFPDLSGEEGYILVTAAKRVWTERANGRHSVPEDN